MSSAQTKSISLDSWLFPPDPIGAPAIEADYSNHPTIVFSRAEQLDYIYLDDKGIRDFVRKLIPDSNSAEELTFRINRELTVPREFIRIAWLTGAVNNKQGYLTSANGDLVSVTIQRPDKTEIKI